VVAAGIAAGSGLTLRQRLLPRSVVLRSPALSRRAAPEPAEPVACPLTGEDIPNGIRRWASR